MIYKQKNSLKARRGVALIIVLGIVMVITIVALAYISRSDGELQYGHNMLLRTQVDYLAESALEHARGLLLNPQEVSGEYWTGATSQQLEDGDFYYDVSVEPNLSFPGDTRWCNYDISCQAYKLSGGERTAQSNLKALLRLNPCIAYWADTSAQQLSSAVTISGDTASDLAYWPDVNITGFTSKYTFESVSSPLLNDQYGPYVKCADDLELAGNVQIEGMLIVQGDLRITGTNNLIRAAKAVPALLVTGDVIVEENADVDIEGLAVIQGKMFVNVGCEDVNVLGAVFARGGIVETVSSVDGLDAIIHGEPESVTESGHAAFSFDGSDDYAQTEDSSSELQVTGDYTLAVWVKANPTQKSWAAIVSKTDPTGSTNHWTLQFDSSNPRELIIHHPSGTWNTGITINDIANQWHHIAVTRNVNTMTSYLDGVFQGSDAWIAVPSSGNGHLNIGVNKTASSSYAYSGMIYDIRIFDESLDVNDVSRVMDDQEVSVGLLAHWRLDEDGQRSIAITAAPAKTAIWCWSASGDREKWSQAAGAFYKVIRRN